MPTIAEVEQALQNAKASDRTDDVQVLQAALGQAMQKQARAMGRGFERAVTQGATFGFGEELESKLTGQPVGEIREEIKAYRQAAPMASVGGELLGGGMLGAGTGAGLLRAGGRAGRALTSPGLAPSAVLGAGEGALYGIGTGETPEQRIMGGMVGAGLGGVAGGMSAPLIGAMTSRLRPGMEAERMVERAVGRDIGRAPTAIDFDVMSTKAGRQPQLTMAETGGATLEDLARTSASMPTGGARQTAEQILDERMRTSTQRLMDSIKAATGSKSKYWQNIRRLEKEAKETAAPLYKQAYQADFLPDDELVSIVQNGMDSGYLRTAYNRAKRIASLEGERLPKWKDIVDKGDKDIVDEGDIAKTLNLKTYDWMKRGLDAQYKALVRRSPEEARALWIYRQELVEKLDDLAPEYSKARAAYAGPMAQKEAQESGANILKEDAELSDEIVANMSQAEKEAYVIGATNALANRIKNVPPEGGQVRITELAFDRLRPAFPDDKSFMAFRDAVMQERSMQKFRNLVLSGSPTARIMASQEDVPRSMGVGAGIGQALGGQPIAGAQTVLSALRPPTAATIPDYINRRLAPMLFGQGPQAASALQKLQRPAMIPRMLGPVTTTEAALLSNLLASEAGNQR